MRQVPARPNAYPIFILFILIMVDELGFWLLLPVLAPLISATSHDFLGLHASAAQRHLLFGLIMALTPFCAIVGAPLLGFISDHLGRKKVLCICLAGTLLGFVLYSLSFWYMSLALLLCARVLVGLTTASQGIVQAAMADLSAGKNKAINISTMACAMTLPLAVGPLLGGYLSDATVVSWFNRATPFILITFLAALNLVLLLFAFKETRKQAPSKIHLKHYLPDLLNFFKAAKTRPLLTAFFLLELGWSLYFQGMPLLLVQKWQFTGAQLGTFSAYIGTCMALALLFLTRIALRFISVRQLLLLNLALVTFALLLGFIAPLQAVLWLTALPVGIGVGLSYTALLTLLSDQVAADAQGLLMGLTDALLYLAFAITGLLAGALTIFAATAPVLLAGLFLLSSLGVSFKYRCALHKA